MIGSTKGHTTLGVKLLRGPLFFMPLKESRKKEEVDAFKWRDKSIKRTSCTIGFSDKRIAVEKNGEIVPKGEYSNVILSDSDTLEVVAFVGGG